MSIREWLLFTKGVLIFVGPILALFIIDLRDRFGWWAIIGGLSLSVYSIWVAMIDE